MANRVTMSICGTEYILVAEEDAAYMEKIGNMVDAEMQKLMEGAENLRRQLKTYLDEASLAKNEAAELRRKLQNAQNQNNRR